MERKELESAAAQVTYLRGLFGIPIGLLFILTGVGNLGWAPLANPWIFLACLGLLVATALAIYRYYNDNYGRATPSRGRQVRYALASVLIGAAMVGGPIVDFNLDLPVSLFAAGFALAVLAWFAICVGLKRRHLVIWGALLVVGLLPIWGGLSDKISVAWFPMGVATMVAGIFDHVALVRSFGPAKDVDLENSNVGA
ncbi:MAG: hypothetical protein QOJ69_132 [Actinomycetota bacterium]|nr:hypothetical protein [Actinomycetota bacterium]